MGEHSQECSMDLRGWAPMSGRLVGRPHVYTSRWARVLVHMIYFPWKTL